MKFALIALGVFMLFFLLPAHAATIENMKIDIALDKEGDAYWEVDIRYKENVTRSDYFALSQVRNHKVYIGENELDCSLVQESIGYSILCNDIFTDKITYTFKAPAIVNSVNEFLLFNYRFPVTNIINNMTVRIDLPIGTAVAEENKLKNFGVKPFEPDTATQSTDGRVIYLSWSFEKPRLGQSVDISVYFEEIGTNENQIQQLVVIIILIGVVAAIALLFMHSRKSTVKDVLPVLTEPERQVMEILLREKKEVDQRIVVKELDYSKSKISRVISDLENRGLIEKTSKGRTNILKLRKASYEKKEPKTAEEKKKDEVVKKILGKDEK